MREPDIDTDSICVTTIRSPGGTPGIRLARPARPLRLRQGQHQFRRLPLIISLWTVLC